MPLCLALHMLHSLPSHFLLSLWRFKRLWWHSVNGRERRSLYELWISRSIDGVVNLKGRPPTQLTSMYLRNCGFGASAHHFPAQVFSPKRSGARVSVQRPQRLHYWIVVLRAFVFIPPLGRPRLFRQRDPCSGPSNSVCMQA